MLAICGGLMRTGSVAMFQIMREIVELRKLGYTPNMPAGRETEHFDANCKDWSMREWISVAKLHQYRPSLAECGDVRVVMTIRDIRDVVVSLMHFRWNSSFETTIHSNAYKNWLHDYQNWVDGIVDGRLLIVRYEDFVSDRFSTVLRVGKFMGVDLNAPEARAIDRKWDVKANQQRAKEEHPMDSINYMSARHIYKGGTPGKWQEELTAEQVAIVEEYAGEWLTEHGYKT